MTSEPNPSDYDFALSDKMNEKLKVAVMLLDEVRFKLARDGEKYTREFMNELTQGTKQITDAIYRVDQPPIIQRQSHEAAASEHDQEFDDCVSEVESLISLIEDDVIKEREKAPTDERKRRMDSLRSILVSGFAIISGMSIVDTETILGQVRQDCVEQRSPDGAKTAGDSMPSEKCFLTECVENRITLGVLEKFLSAYGWLWHQCYAEGRIDESVMESAKQNVAQYVRQFGWKIRYGKMKCKVVTRSRLVIRAGDWD